MPTEQRDNYLAICAAFAGFALLSAVVAIGFGVRAIDTAEAAPTTGGGSTVPVALAEFTIGSGAVQAAAGDVLAVSNDGSTAHDLEIIGTDLKTPMLAPGEAAELSLAGLAPGEYEVHCTVPGHDSAGMTGTLTVTDTDTDSGLAAGGAEVDHDAMGHGSASTDSDEMDAKHRERTMAFPAETEGLGGVDLEPTILEDGTKRFELTVSQIQWEVEPGKFVEAMAYNGIVPGPTIRGEVGDDVEIVVTNEMDESTAVHWHGILVPNAMDGVPDITQEPIRPGETFTYAFPLREPAVGMYHSHHNAAHQVPDGLAGAFLVGEMPSPDDVEITQEIPMMLNDAGAIGFSINGKSFPATEPIVADLGERIMVHYLNEGLVNHPMHLHGMWQLVVAKDGAPLETPYLADTIDVAPGERYTVIVDVTEPGVWAWHCHILTHAESDQGMFGMVTALITEESDA